MSNNPDDTWEDSGATWADLRPVTVYAECSRDWINENTVECVNIEEDFQGRDVVTFECPLCKATHKSLRRG